MKLDETAIKRLAPIICGDKLAPYKTGYELVELFNKYGCNDEYTRGFPSRWFYTENKLREINETKNMEKFLNDFLYSRNYIDSKCDLDKIADEINKDISYIGYKIEKINGEYVVTGDGLLKEDVEVKVAFENIQKNIIEEIRKAKYIIWVAVAWFTDEVLFDELIKKKEEGVNVQIIISDDEINRGSQLKYEKYFETYRKKKFGLFGENILHNKFCVIDLHTVIHGSYNWSRKAQYNDENIDILRNTEHAKKYADRFKELKLKE